MSDFASEFRGLFWGEGCADIQRYHRPSHSYPLYRPRLRITLAENESDLLFYIRDRLGGYVTFHKQAARAYLIGTWQITQRYQLVEVCDLLLDGCLPSSKIQQVQIVRNAAAYNLRPGSKLGADGRAYMDQQYQELHALKDIRSGKVQSSVVSASGNHL